MKYGAFFRDKTTPPRSVEFKYNMNNARFDEVFVIARIIKIKVIV